jgi:hypothetical protein
VTRTPDMITGHGTSGPLLSHTPFFRLFVSLPKNLQEMGHEDGTVVALQKKKKSRKEKGEYMRRIFCSSWSALIVKISVADQDTKRAEIELPATQDDGHSLEVKEKKKKKGKAKDAEEFVLPRGEDTPGE